MKFQALFAREGLSLDRLRTLVLIEEAGSIAAAAPADRSRQSLFSRQLNELEHFFPVPLKQTHGRTVTLTARGRELAQLAREHLQALEGFHRASVGRPPEITLGAGESLHHWLVLPRFARLQKTSSHAVWHLRTLQNHTMSRQLAEGSLDFGLLRADLVTGKLQGESIGQIGYSLFVPDRILSRTQRVPLREALAQLPLATQGDDTLFQRRLDEAVTRRGWKLNVQLYGETFPHVAQAVASGAVAGLLPDVAASTLDATQVWRLPLAELSELNRNISLTWNPHHLAKRNGFEKIRTLLLKNLRFSERRLAPRAEPSL